MEGEKWIPILLEKWVKATIELCFSYNKVTIDSLAVITISLLWFPDLNLDFATVALKNYYSAPKGLTKSKKAGLTLSVANTHTMFKKFKFANQNISDSASVYLTALLETISKKIGENPQEIKNLPFKVLV